ncbi:MAG TPA: PilZ domain-containing protein [Anaerolineaceae bacterium]|nr:PilZ domain-containing protein [Anaerolineaceae bacterium]HPN49945.1 PilZ domain-containing protein [Anaerolineaceae bacterium]
MDERRKLTRNHLIHYLRVFNRDTGELLGNMVDISPEGFLLLSDHPIPINTALKFRMEFPEEFMGKKRLDFEAHSVWFKADVNPDLFATGFKIESLDQTDRKILESLISEYQDS